MFTSFIENIEILAKLGGAIFLVVMVLGCFYFVFLKIKDKFGSKTNDKFIIDQLGILDNAFNDVDEDLWKLGLRVEDLEYKISSLKFNKNITEIAFDEPKEEKPKRKPGRPPWKKKEIEQKTP